MERDLEPGEKTPQEFYGIRMSDVSDEILNDIVTLYLDTAGIGPVSWKSITTEQFLEHMEYMGGSGEFRFG